ncbi:hypothetical protein C6P46_001462 [Rhodotorula mucilaginosa]|uniref:Uncharacterized protein n=1 Tax=Rhodotorula mucilaginosa TaxID=5537 RepID=A0A9P7B7L7_RHOMI|nr:hypothetical protein C6P46_001462 [Rhodotorula mucilaginosa]
MASYYNTSAQPARKGTSSASSRSSVGGARRKMLSRERWLSMAGPCCQENPGIAKAAASFDLIRATLLQTDPSSAGLRICCKNSAEEFR